MLLLLETPAGYGIFKLTDKALASASAQQVDESLRDAGNVAKSFKLKDFSAFEDTAMAVAECSDIIEGRVPDMLKAIVKGNCKKGVELGVADKELGKAIKDACGVQCVFNSSVFELLRAVRTHSVNLISQLTSKHHKTMSLALAHSLSRQKIKFSADKVDVMIIQAVGLLDDLDKEVNNFAMRLREWYGWHFPELANIVSDGLTYAKLTRVIGMRANARNVDWDAVMAEGLVQLDENVAKEVVAAAEISSGTEITEVDLEAVHELADRVQEMLERRADLADYLRSRMGTVAPNLTYMVGELVGARLISHAGSLMSLAKQPSSTLQILGAEKALFRALKNKKNTPKYGLIFNASLVGQAPAAQRGRISRSLAAKMSISARVDALSEGDDRGVTVGTEYKAFIEKRLSTLEDGAGARAAKRARK